METTTRNIEDLICFYLVAREGGFTKAAQHLGSSKAMVSKQIKRLEASLGTQLFFRTTRKLSLTQEGEALMSYSEKIFQLSDEAGKRLQTMAKGHSGLVRISTPVSLGEFFFPSFVESMRSVLPQVQFECDLSNEARDLSKNETDFAIRATETIHPDLIARHLGRLRDVICVAKNFKGLEMIEKRGPQALHFMDCILHSQEPLWNDWTLTSPRGDVRIEVRGKVATNQYEMIRAFCKQGLGPARIPYYIVAEEIKQGNLIQIFPEYQISTHSINLVYLRSEFGSPKLKITKEAILKWFSDRKEIFV